MKPFAMPTILRHTPHHAPGAPPTPDDAAALLAVIPSSPPYPEWIKVIAAVAACGFSLVETNAILTAWSPDQKPGETVGKIRSLQSGARPPSLGALVNIAKAHGLDAPAFARDRWQRNQQSPPPRHHAAAIRFAPAISPAATQPLNATQTPASVDRTPPNAAPPREIKHLEKLRAPTENDLYTIADIRDLPLPESIKILRQVADKGLLFTAALADFADIDNPPEAGGQWERAHAWIFTDGAKQIAAARRMDGETWKHIGGKKTWFLKNSRADWVTGLAEAASDPAATIGLCEGAPDALALFVLRRICAEFRNIAPAAFATCSTEIPPEQLPCFTGRNVILFAQHDTRHTAGQDAARKWTAQLRGANAATIQHFDLTKWRVAGHDGHPPKDINDFLKYWLDRSLLNASDTAGNKAEAKAGATPADATAGNPAPHAPEMCPVCRHFNIMAPIGGMTCSSFHSSPEAATFIAQTTNTATAIL